jgi:hypothetical protein
MANIKVDRHVIVRAGVPSAIEVGVVPGAVWIEATHDGVRMRIELAPVEAKELGAGILMSVPAAMSSAAAPAKPLDLVNGGS